MRLADLTRQKASNFFWNFFSLTSSFICSINKEDLSAISILICFLINGLKILLIKYENMDFYLWEKLELIVLLIILIYSYNLAVIIYLDC